MSIHRLSIRQFWIGIAQIPQDLLAQAACIAVMSLRVQRRDQRRPTVLVHSIPRARQHPQVQPLRTHWDSPRPPVGIHAVAVDIGGNSGYLTKWVGVGCLFQHDCDPVRVRD